MARAQSTEYESAPGVRVADATAIGHVTNPLLLEQEAGSPGEPPPASADSGRPRSKLLINRAEPLQWMRSFPEGLSLDQLRDFALGADPGVQRARLLVHSARGRALQVGLKPNPLVGLDMQQLFSDGEVEQYGVVYQQKFVWQQKLDLNRSVAGHVVQRRLYELRVQEQRVLTDIHLAYIQALRTQREIDVTRGLLAVDQQARELTVSLYKADEVANTDVLQAELQESRSEVKLHNAENAHQAAWRQLQVLTGQADRLPPQPLSGDFFDVDESLDYSECLNGLLANHPERSVLLAEIERARCDLRRQQIDPLPDVDFFGLVNWRDNGYDGQPNAGVGFAVPVPVHNRNQGAIYEARYALLAAEQRLGQLDRNLEIRLNRVFLTYENARQRVQRYSDEMLPQATESLELIGRTYEVGETPFSSLLIAQRTFAELQLAMIDALEDLHTSTALIEGLLLSGADELRD